jgi:hypothetical protein
MEPNAVLTIVDFLAHHDCHLQHVDLASNNGGFDDLVILDRVLARMNRSPARFARFGSFKTYYKDYAGEIEPDVLEKHRVIEARFCQLRLCVPPCWLFASPTGFQNATRHPERSGPIAV